MNWSELGSSHFVDRVEADNWGLENPGEALPYGALSGERQTTQNNQHCRRIHAPTLPNFRCTCRSADRSRAPDPRAGGRELYSRRLGSGVAVRVEGDDGSAELAPAEDTLRHKVLKVVIEAPTIVHFEMRLEKPGS